MKKTPKGSGKTWRVPRTGIGYDIHRFRAGRRLMLGGVHIPSRAGLDGHSDADVLLHAICDALLGAAALGDIGDHFPNSRKEWKNISSLKLLSAVRDMLTRKNWSVVHVDAVVVLERPKISGHKALMCKRIARALSVSEESISLKATTNEMLGALGRREGCAAIATATIVPS